MPYIFAHEGIWEGVYKHVDVQGNNIDQHKSRVECIFPDEGNVVYIQKNRFEWDDGRVETNEFSGILICDRIYWDTNTFKGFGWQANKHIFLLELDRKDELDAKFYEIIVMDKGSKTRARTWHWFKDGNCYKRTLCDEWLIKQ